MFMTEYTDIPEANRLYLLIQDCDRAIDMIDAGTGTLTNFTVGGNATTVQPTNTSPMLSMPVNIPVAQAAPETVTQIRAELITYQNELTTQLESLGVVNPPVKAE
jgi:hypothetical protein